jgi:hypothetical protein
MEMVIHDAEVQELKRVLLFSFLEEYQEHSLDITQLEVSEPAVNFGGTVVNCSVSELSEPAINFGGNVVNCSVSELSDS